MLGADLNTVEIILPAIGRFADRNRLLSGLYFTCHYRTPFNPQMPETVRTARAGQTVDLSEFSRIGTIGLQRAEDNRRVQCAYVAIDIDNKTGNKDNDIELCVLRLRPYDFVEVRRSTSGKGLHLYIPLVDCYLETKIPEDESAESWKSVLVNMRAEYRKIKARVEHYIRDILRDTVPIDAVGGNNAIWMYTEMGCESSFELLKPASVSLDLASIPAIDSYAKEYKGDTASPRPRSAPGLPKVAPPKIIAFIQALESWRPRDVPDAILGHFHLAHLQPALLVAGIAGYCGVKTNATNLSSPNAYLIYSGEGRQITDYAVCAMNGSQPLWEDNGNTEFGVGKHPRLVLGTVSLNQLEALSVICPDSAKLNGCSEIHDDMVYMELVKLLALRSLKHGDTEVSPFADGQRGATRFPRVEWRPGQIIVRHDMGTATARKIEESSQGFWTASSRGVSCSIRLITQGTVVPKATDNVVFDDELKGKLYDHFCMVDPAHVNNGNRIDGLFCAPFYMRNTVEEPWQPLTTTADLTTSLVSLVNVNVKSASRARQVLRDQRAKYLTHHIHKPMGRYKGEHGTDCWNNPLNILVPKVSGRKTTWEVDTMVKLSGNIMGGVEGNMNVPYLIWWLKERILNQAAVLPTLHFENSKNAATFRMLAAACFVYPVVLNMTLTTRLSVIPIRTLILYTPRVIDEIPSPNDRIVTIKDSTGPLTTYSVIASNVSQGITDGVYDIVIVNNTLEEYTQPYMGDFVYDVVNGKYN